MTMNRCTKVLAALTLVSTLTACNDLLNGPNKPQLGNAARGGDFELQVTRVHGPSFAYVGDTLQFELEADNLFPCSLGSPTYWWGGEAMVVQTFGLSRAADPCRPARLLLPTPNQRPLDCEYPVFFIRPGGQPVVHWLELRARQAPSDVKAFYESLQDDTIPRTYLPLPNTSVAQYEHAIGDHIDCHRALNRAILASPYRARRPTREPGPGNWDTLAPPPQVRRANR